MDNLSYDVTTTKGIRYRFKSTTEGLHMFIVNPKSVKYVFREKVVDNLTDNGDNMCYIGNSNLIGVINKESLIRK